MPYDDALFVMAIEHLFSVIALKARPAENVWSYQLARGE